DLFQSSYAPRLRLRCSKARSNSDELVGGSKKRSEGVMLIHLSTVVWGTWHIEAFLEVNLPSLLAPGNLPVLAARHQTEYFIYTTAEDIPRIESSPAFIRAKAFLPIQLLAIR